MTTRAEFWTDFDSRPRGASDDADEAPPHASRCLKHEKWLRGPCPYCVHEQMYPGMAMDDHDPRFYMRGRKHRKAEPEEAA